MLSLHPDAWRTANGPSALSTGIRFSVPKNASSRASMERGVGKILAAKGARLAHRIC